MSRKTVYQPFVTADHNPDGSIKSVTFDWFDTYQNDGDGNWEPDRDMPLTEKFDEWVKENFSPDGELHYKVEVEE